MVAALICIAQTVYFEARDQPVAGQLAVAQVVVNRMESDGFPDDACEVVKQGGDFRKYRCHFSWYCDGKSDRPKNQKAWAQAQLIASAVLDGTRMKELIGVTHYHANYVSPYWTDFMSAVTQVGDHIFYKEI